MNRQLRLFAWGLAGWAGLSLSAATAATLVNDTWLDGTDTDPAAPVYSEAGTDSDSDNDLESVWYRGGGGVLDPVGPGGPLRGTNTASSSSWTTYFTAEASEVELTQPGDALTVTWRFRTGDVNASNTSQNFRAALVDSASAVRLAADGAPASGAYSGYALFVNMGETFNRSNPVQLLQRAGASGAFLGTSGDWTNVGTPGGATGNVGFQDNTDYALVWSIVRNGSGNLDVTSTLTGGNINSSGSVSATALNVAPNNGSYKFDTFGLRPSTAATTADMIDTTLFRVEFSRVPEPTSLGLAAVGGLALLGRRRR